MRRRFLVKYLDALLRFFLRFYLKVSATKSQFDRSGGSDAGSSLASLVTSPFSGLTAAVPITGRANMGVRPCGAFWNPVRQVPVPALSHSSCPSYAIALKVWADCFSGPGKSAWYNTAMSYTIAAFYRFTSLADVSALRLDLKQELMALGLCGTLLLAAEGINGTLAGDEGAINVLLTLLDRRFGLPREEVKFSHAAEKPFPRLKVRVKPEIITFRRPDADPSVQVGTYVAPEDWNALLADPDVLLLDTRNRYETRLGTFQDALLPQTEHFSEFAGYACDQLDPARDRKIALFCTGGIRCEKASAFLLSEGFAEVYHLKGGILKYLEEVPAAQSRWQGECYVFDHRMAVGPGLTTGRYAMCFSCGEALSEEDRARADYEEGVSCGFCFAETTDADKARFRTRHVQMTKE